MEFAAFKKQTLNDHFMAIVGAAFDYTRKTRSCSGISDHDFVLLSIWRALDMTQNGRDFLQSLEDGGHGSACCRSTYFEALSSARRLEMYRDVSEAINRSLDQTMADRGIDHLSCFPELEGRTVVAGDGHAIEHACHAKRRKSGRYACESNIHLLDLHTGLAFYLARIQGDGEHAHEIPTLRRTLPLWQSKLPKQDKAPILVYDRAAVDKTFWSRMAMAKEGGIKLITRTKTSMSFCFRTPRSFDASLPINEGVLSVESVGQDNAVDMRIVSYQNPEDGKVYEFLTTVKDLEPGLIAWLYFLRWKIEKCFDVFKNKMGETKGWAASKEAQEVQARACCCTHNLLQVLHVLFADQLEIKTDKRQKKRALNLECRAEAAEACGKKLHPLQFSAHHLFQLSQQFIRAVRNLFFDARPIRELLPLFRKRMTAYL